MKRRRTRSSRYVKIKPLITLTVTVIAITILVLITSYYYWSQSNTGAKNLSIIVNGQTYTFKITPGAKLKYKWYQVLVYPNGTQIPFGRVSNGTFTYTIVNVSTKKVFKTEKIPIWFIVKIVRNNVESQGLSKVYFTSIALPIELLGKPVLNMTPVKEKIDYHGKSIDVWVYRGRLEPRSPECYVFEDEYYYSTTGLLLLEKTKCYPPPSPSYPNGTYILYYRELVSVSS